MVRNRQTDRPTDIATYRAAIAAKNKSEMHYSYSNIFCIEYALFIYKTHNIFTDFYNIYFNAIEIFFIFGKYVLGI